MCGKNSQEVEWFEGTVQCPSLLATIMVPSLRLPYPPCPSSPQGTSNGLGSIDDIETGNVPDMSGRGGDGAPGRAQSQDPREVR